MSFFYAHAAHLAGQGAIDYVNDDLRVVLVMANTTADSEKDVTTMDGFTTLDEMDGANYARQALANEAWTKDAANARSELDADDVTFMSLGAGTRNVQAAIIYKHVTDDTDSIPIAYIDGTGFPFAASGGDETIAWNAEGILQHSY